VCSVCFLLNIHALIMRLRLFFCNNYNMIMILIIIYGVLSRVHDHIANFINL